MMKSNFRKRRGAISFGKFTDWTAVVTAVCLMICGAVFALTGCDAELSAAEERQAEQNQQDAKGAAAVIDVSGRMEADFLDIGKADCTVIRSDSQVTVVDTGYQETAETVLAYLDSIGVERIDHLILTHFDKDHVGGAAALLEKYEIGMIYQPDYSAKEEDSKPYLRYEETLQKEDLHPVTVKDNLTVIMEDVVFTIYPPEKLEYSRDKDNNRSLVTTVQHGDVRMFLAGDAERDRIDEILTQIPDLKSDLLKVPHHGHRERNSSELFQAVDPRYAVICADRDDKSDGPDDDIIETLEEGGAQVFTTGDGVVQAVSDGTNLSVRQ